MPLADDHLKIRKPGTEVSISAGKRGPWFRNVEVHRTRILVIRVPVGAVREFDDLCVFVTNEDPVITVKFGIGCVECVLSLSLERDQFGPSDDLQPAAVCA